MTLPFERPRHSGGEMRYPLRIHFSKAVKWGPSPRSAFKPTELVTGNNAKEISFLQLDSVRTYLPPMWRPRTMGVPQPSRPLPEFSLSLIGSLNVSRWAHGPECGNAPKPGQPGADAGGRPRLRWPDFPPSTWNWLRGICPPAAW